MQVNRLVQIKAGQNGEDIGLQHCDEKLEADEQNVYRAVSGISTPAGYRRPGSESAGTRPRQDPWDDDEN